MQLAMKRVGVSCLALAAGLVLLGTVAAAAQAGEFRVGGKTFLEAGVKAELVAGTIEESKFEVSWLGFAITCKGGTLTGEALQGGSVNASATFHECIVVGAEKTCTIQNASEEAGVIDIQGSGSVIEHGGTHYVKFANQTFTTLYIVGPKCTLQEEMEAAGSSAVAFSSALSELSAQPFAAVTGAKEGALLEIAVTCAGEPAAILGSSGSVELTGAHAGETWGFE